MYAPEISMGFSTVEELRDIEDVPFVELKTAPKAPTIPAPNSFDEDDVIETAEVVDTETGEVKDGNLLMSKTWQTKPKTTLTKSTDALGLL